MAAEISGSLMSGEMHSMRRRLLVWRSYPVRPFVWWGLLPLLGLAALLAYGLWPFARGDIEANVRHSVGAALASRGLSQVQMQVSGQQVHLSGRLPANMTQADALALAQGALCATWLGDKPCAVTVTAAFESPLPPATAAREPAPAPALQEARPPAAVAAACERALAAEVERSRIEFAVGSARLLDSSQAVVERVAKAAVLCPGVITVEGHTDAMGDPQRNRALSLARAHSVRDALVAQGLSPARLQVRGHGADKPVADNTSAEGRRSNRRIEFKLMVSN